ncbi:MAG: hypothetical protein NT154_13190, partial [Verrucomicrobia bacterium]|nr:hypothetical protein [Verrucomicrobiota bacterium]
EPSGHGYYPTTIWSEVERAGSADAEVAAEALRALIGRYYTPLRRHLMSAFRVDESGAQDWLHDFVHQRILLGDILRKASRNRGLFRTYLLNCLQNFVTSQFRRDAAQCRRPKGGIVSLEELQASNAEPSSEALWCFTVDWARQVLDLALGWMEAEYKAKGWDNRWELFTAQVLEPTLNGTPTPQYDPEFIKALGFQSPSEASNAMVTAKRRLQRLLEEVVAEYAGKDADVKAEIRELIKALSDGRGGG